METSVAGVDVVRAQSLCKLYPSGRRGVDKISLSIVAGRIVGLLGSNGAGKSTIVKLLCGLSRPTSGEVLIDGTDVTTWSMHRRARLGIGVVLQDCSLLHDATVEENLVSILQFSSLSRRERKQTVERLLGRVGLSAHRQTEAATLSAGERRRLELARCLATRPRIVLLDEPFNGIRPNEVTEIQEIISEIRDSNVAVLLTDHRERELLSFTDFNYIIHQGRILVSGNAQTILEQPITQQHYFGKRYDAVSIIESKSMTLAHSEATEEPTEPRRSSGFSEATGRSEPESIRPDQQPQPDDRVQFSAFCAESVRRGSPFVLEVFAHSAAQRDEVVRLAAQVSRTHSAGRKSAIRIEYGTNLTVTVQFPNFTIANCSEIIEWQGEIGNATFVIEVPENAKCGSHVGTAQVIVKGLVRARFAIEVIVSDHAIAAESRLRGLMPGVVNSVFASYSSEDRVEVLRFKHFVESVGVDVFVDVMNLRSGEDWESRLWVEIPKRDLFCLFWSAASSKSEWVEKEWRAALKAKGCDFIQPIPLADPRSVPPPKPLGDCRHFESMNRIALEYERFWRSTNSS